MVTPSKKILVLGATGVIGAYLVKALISAKEDFERIAIFTSAETATNKAEALKSLKLQGVEVIVGDLNNDNEVLEAFKGFDTVVSAVGRTAIDKQIDLIALAEKSPSIVRFIPSEYGTDIKYDASSANEKPHQKKLKVRAYIESDAVSRLKYTYLVTGPFADLYMGDMSHEPALGSFDVRNKEATLLGDGNGKISLTTMADVGRFLIGVLKHPEACDDRAVLVNSFTTTPKEILAEFERQTGAKWKVNYTPLDELKKCEDQAWEKGNPLATGYTLRRIWTEGKTLYDKTDIDVIGSPKTDTLEMVVQELVKRPASGFRSGKM